MEVKGANAFINRQPIQLTPGGIFYVLTSIESVGGAKVSFNNRVPQ